jgi:hypothetical protein
MLQRQALALPTVTAKAYAAIAPIKYDKQPQNVKANQTFRLARAGRGTQCFNDGLYRGLMSPALVLCLDADTRHFAYLYDEAAFQGRLTFSIQPAVYFPNRSKRYASSGPPFPVYASWATSSANGSV